MNTPSWITELFAAIDRMDTKAFLSFFEEDGTFRFGNWPVAKDQAAIAATVDGFLGGIAGLSHRILEVWTHPEHAIVEGEVTYRRKDGTELTVPFANIFRLGASGRIAEYRVFADVSAL